MTVQEAKKEGEDESQRATFEILLVAKDNEELGKVWQTWLLAFDARKCECYDEKDKDRMMDVIEKSSTDLGGDRVDFEEEIGTGQFLSILILFCALVAPLVRRREQEEHEEQEELEGRQLQKPDV